MFDSFDPFTPHIRVLSLGGIRVHEGAWTALEVMQRLEKTESFDLLHARQIENRLYAQLNSLRLTWDASLIGLSLAQYAILFIDARYNEEWIKLSGERAIQELFIWHKARSRQELEPNLSVIIWCEHSTQVKEIHKNSLTYQSVRKRIHKTIELLNIELLCEINSQILSKSLDTQEEVNQHWSSLSYYFASPEQLEKLEQLEAQDQAIEQVEYIDAEVLVPAGHFYQGGSRLAPSTEKPRHQVKISKPFWVGQTQVTKRFWSEVMQQALLSNERGDEPMSEVNWFDAIRFCNALSKQQNLELAYEIEEHTLPEVKFKPKALGYRLLSESEWEYVSRGGEGNSLTAPSTVNPPAWTQERSQLSLRPVAQLDSNAWGLYDCLGNVAEWCQDVYRADLYQDRKLDRLSVDPVLYTSGAGERVIRGGSFEQAAYLVTHSRRDACHPLERWSSIGFRIMRPKASD